MAERFYFDLTDGVTTIRDETGVVAVDLSDAVNQAMEVIAEMRDDDEHERDALRWMMVVCDSTGKTVTTMPVVPRDPAASKAS